MNSLQYTIRSIPEKLDNKLRTQAKHTGKSLNAVVVDYLQLASGTAGNKQHTYSDLDWFCGSGKTDDKSFSNMQDWLDSAPL